MLNKSKCLPPEPLFSGYLNFLYKVLIYLRASTANADQMQKDDLVRVIRDVNHLADALHNIPTFLREMDDWFTPDTMRDTYIASYDQRPSPAPKMFQLVALLDDCIREARERQK
jgi:hypothetical protein